MGQIFHGCATTTEAGRREIQDSQESLRVLARRHGIEHRLTKPNHPWINGRVERMNRKIKAATVKRYHYDSHDQLRYHLHEFVSAYDFARQLKALKGLSPYE